MAKKLQMAAHASCLAHSAYLTVCITMQLCASVTEEVCRSIVKYGDTSHRSLIGDLDLASGCIQGLSPL